MDLSPILRAWVLLALAAATAGAALLFFPLIGFHTIPIPTTLKIGDRSIPLHRSGIPAAAPSPQMTALPPVHNSADTECGDRKQCSAADFADLADNLRRQWALVPEEIRAKCSTNQTYPPLEHCILSQSI